MSQFVRSVTLAGVADREGAHDRRARSDPQRRPPTPRDPPTPPATASRDPAAIPAVPVPWRCDHAPVPARQRDRSRIVLRAQLGRPARDVVGHRRALRVRQPDGRRDRAATGRRHAVPDVLLPDPPRGDGRDVGLEADAGDARAAATCSPPTPTSPPPTRARTSAYLADRATFGEVDEIDGHLGRRHADPRQVPARARRRTRSPRVPASTRSATVALALSTWSPDRCVCAEPRGRRG